MARRADGHELAGPAQDFLGMWRTGCMPCQWLSPQLWSEELARGAYVQHVEAQGGADAARSVELDRRGH